MLSFFLLLFSDLWNETHSNKKNKKRSNDPMNPDRRRKPITVTGPYIVYMLKDVDIIEDWTTIKKVRNNKISRAWRETVVT